MSDPGDGGKRGRGRPPGRPGLKVVRRKGSASLYLDGTINGKRVRQVLNTDSPVLAEEARAQRETELYRSAIYGTPEETTFMTAIVSYLALGHAPSTVRNVHRLGEYFGPKIACREITQAAIDRAGRAICPTARLITIHRQVVTPMKAILNHAARRGWTDPPRFERVKAGGRRTDWLTPAEGEALIEGASELIRPLLIFLLGTGARVGEAIALDWRDVDLSHGRATLRHTKNGDDRPLDLAPRVVAALAGLPWEQSGERAGPVFRHRRGKAYRHTTGAAQVAYGGQIRKAFAAALRAAGIARAITPHHLRHTWATWHYAVHRDLMKLRDDGGWRTVAMCERYAKLAPAGMAAEIRTHWGPVALPSDRRIA